MFDIGWSELMVIGAIALIVVGPKDLPGLLRQLGRYAAQARGMAREFQRSMEEAAREADIGDLKELKDAGRQLDNIKRMKFDAGLGGTERKAKAAATAASTARKAAGGAAASAGAAAAAAAPASEGAAEAEKPAETSRNAAEG
jgi:twin arginine-targeting protein translocase TatB